MTHAYQPTEAELTPIYTAMPEIEQINDPDLRRKVAEAWVIALNDSSFNSLEEIPGEADIDSTVSQLTHQRGVTILALRIAEGMQEIMPDIQFDRDIIIAGGLVHDIGKAYEYDPERAAKWRARPQESGYPAIRHPAYGVHIALMAGLPDSVAHICATHAKEGNMIQRSLEGMLIHYADDMFWNLVAKAHKGLTAEDLTHMALPADGLRALPRRHGTDQ
jgi:putative nucleotidyltransferase with HDIG domain